MRVTQTEEDYKRALRGLCASNVGELYDITHPRSALGDTHQWRGKNAQVLDIARNRDLAQISNQATSLPTADELYARLQVILRITNSIETPGRGTRAGVISKIEEYVRAVRTQQRIVEEMRTFTWRDGAVHTHTPPGLRCAPLPAELCRAGAEGLYLVGLLLGTEPLEEQPDGLMVWLRGGDLSQQLFPCRLPDAMPAVYTASMRGVASLFFRDMYAPEPALPGFCVAGGCKVYSMLAEAPLSVLVNGTHAADVDLDVLHLLAPYRTQETGQTLLVELLRQCSASGVGAAGRRALSIRMRIDALLKEAEALVSELFDRGMRSDIMMLLAMVVDTWVFQLRQLRDYACIAGRMAACYAECIADLQAGSRALGAGNHDTNELYALYEAADLRIYFGVHHHMTSLPLEAPLLALQDALVACGWRRVPERVPGEVLLQHVRATLAGRRDLVYAVRDQSQERQALHGLVRFTPGGRCDGTDALLYRVLGERVRFAPAWAEHGLSAALDSYRMKHDRERVSRYMFSNSEVWG